jgi:putative SOS response-associated peptidase YedK
MCGRCTLYTVVQEILERFKVKQSEIPFQPSYNIYPSHPVLAVVKDDQGENQLREFIWGLVPPWSPDPTVGIPNARAEGVDVKSSFRGAFRKRRCLVAADGFYEWQKSGKTKTPMYIRLKSGKPFGFAGLYEVWKPKPDSPLQHEVATCTIITTEPNELMKPIHNRMPVILSEKAEDLWLDPKIDNIPTLRSLLRPYPEDEMEAYEVSTFVNSPRNNTPECIAPVGETPKAQLEALPLFPSKPSKGFLEKAKKIQEEKRR